MIRLSALIGQNAVALASAQTTGTVTGIVLEGSRIVAVQLSGSTIPAEAVRSFEGDVLTYDERTIITHGSTNDGDPRSKRVLDMHGDQIGVIADLGISADGTVETIELTSGDAVPGARLRAVGTYAAVLNVDLPPPTGQPVA
jgi:hypothetical protein